MTPAIALIVAVLLFLVAPPPAGAQPAGKVWRIGYLSLTSDSVSYRPWLAALRDGLRDLGYVDGQNIVIEPRYAAGQVERLSPLAAELVRLKVDVLVTAPAGTALAAKSASRTIPIVFIGEPDPVGTLVASLAHPGGNVTGLSDAHADLVPKRLELLKQVVPSVTRVGILWSPANPGTAPQVRIAEGAASALGLTVLPVAVKGPRRDDLDRAFATIERERLGSLFVIGDSTLGVQRDRLAALSLQHRPPATADGRRVGC